ncbi:hypothetical protein [Hyphococcus sp.]|uniref:hypothetical protein n=1 Tax=Hyphococcus sp. TaxID=2038636 RepID=UPI0035C6FA94
MKKVLSLFVSSILMSIFTTSCQQQIVQSEASAQHDSDSSVSESASDIAEPPKDPVTMSQQKCSKTPEGVAGLPYAHGKVFATLDEYLAHLQQLSAIDLPYWREVRPGVYEQVVHMPEATTPKTATREELLAMYCFDSE